MMKSGTRNELKARAKAKAFADQVDVKKGKQLTKAYLAMKSFIGSKRGN